MSTENQTLLVTGGAGFIGSHIVEGLVGDGGEVVVFDNFTTGSKRNLEPVADSITIVEGDIRNEDQVAQVFDDFDIDIVSHQAAQLEITTALEDPQMDLETNTRGSLNVFEASVDAGVEKVLYASSACVYGEAEEVPQSESSHPTAPNWPYGVSKLAVEKYADIYSKFHGVPFVGLRYGITYGPREWFGRVMTVFLKRALGGKPPVVWGGDQVRDFVHVSDAVRLHNELLDADVYGSEQFNVGTGVGTSIEDLAKLVLEVSGLDEEVVYEDVDEGERSEKVDGRERLPLELQRMVLNPEKASEHVDWKPTVTVEEGVERQYNWVREHPSRWTEMSY